MTHALLRIIVACTLAATPLLAQDSDTVTDFFSLGDVPESGIVLDGDGDSDAVAVSVEPVDLMKVNCGNLVYAENQTSVCFADVFLSKANDATTIDINTRFVRVPLDSDELFNFPFCVFSGEDDFILSQAQRDNLRTYLLSGGFILASPGCSDKSWDKALRRELQLTFPDFPLERIPMTHPLFSVVNTLRELHDKKGKSVQLEGLIVKDRIVLVYSHEGLNDVGNAKGCCCCGGNEIKEAQDVNVNVITYSLLY